MVKRSYRDGAEFVINSLDKLGITPHPESRLMRMYRILAAPGDRSNIITPADTEFETALEGIRDLTQLEFVFDHLDLQSLGGVVIERLRKTIKDPVLPQDNTELSPGRDTQFELYVAALCSASNLQPVTFEEPDITCMANGVKFGIAAKRLKNATNLEHHARKAAKQIQDCGFPGIIAIDTTIALNRENNRITSKMSDRQCAAIHKEALRRFVHRHYLGILEWVRAKNVRGIVIHDHQVRFDGDWILWGMTFWVETTRGNMRRSREAAMFHEAYVRGLANRCPVYT